MRIKVSLIGDGGELDHRLIHLTPDAVELGGLDDLISDAVRDILDHSIINVGDSILIREEV